MVKALSFLLLSAFIFNLSQANNTFNTPLPKPEKSFTLTYIQNEATCTYLVAVNTSCSSSIFTRDNISLAFGDDSGNQIYARSLDGPESTFKPCSSDLFKIEGPCAKQICYGYLYKTGPDNWIPEVVKIYRRYDTSGVTFYYNTTIPNELWYGYSLCKRPTAPPPPITPPPPPPPHYPPITLPPPPPHNPPPPPPHYPPITQPPPPPPPSPPPPPPPPPPHYPPITQPPPPPPHYPPPSPSPSPPPPPPPPTPTPPSSSYRRYAPAGWFVLTITGLVAAL